MRLGQSPGQKATLKRCLPGFPRRSWLSLAGCIRQRHADKRDCPIVTAASVDSTHLHRSAKGRIQWLQDRKHRRERKDGAESFNGRVNTCIVTGGGM
jgi:hypothetical protein